MKHLLPVLTVVIALLAVWYIACIPMNVKEVLTTAERAGVPIDPPSAAERRDMGHLALVLRNTDALGGSWSQDRARLPSPPDAVAISSRTLFSTVNRPASPSGEDSDRPSSSRMSVSSRFFST